MGCCCSSKTYDKSDSYTRFDCVDKIDENEEVHSPISYQLMRNLTDSEDRDYTDGRFGSDIFVKKMIKTSSKKVFIGIDTGELSFSQLIYDLEKGKRIASTLQHIRDKSNPFILQPIFSNLNEERLFIRIEYTEGKNLKYCLHYFRYEIPENIVIFITAQIVLGLDFLHKNDIIHNNLSLKNILLFKDGYIKISNFGASFVTKVRSKIPIGVVEYMAPEILLGQLCDSNVDWWSLGICMATMLGRYPFDIQRLRDSIILDEPLLPKQASAICKTFMSGLLTKNQNERLYRIVSEERHVDQHEIFKCIYLRDLAENSIRLQLHIKYIFKDVFYTVLEI